MVEGYRDAGQGPRPMKAGVERVLRHLNAPETDVVQSIFSEWSALVGELIGAHSRPVDVADGILVIEADDPAWASELGWLADDLVGRLRDRLDTNEINEIRVRVRR